MQPCGDIEDSLRSGWNRWKAFAWMCIILSSGQSSDHLADYNSIEDHFLGYLNYMKSGGDTHSSSTALFLTISEAPKQHAAAAAVENARICRFFLSVSTHACCTVDALGGDLPLTSIKHMVRYYGESTASFLCPATCIWHVVAYSENLFKIIIINVGRNIFYTIGAICVKRINNRRIFVVGLVVRPLCIYSRLCRHGSFPRVKVIAQ